MTADRESSPATSPAAPGAAAAAGPGGALLAIVGLGVGLHALGWFLVAAAQPHAAAALEGMRLVGTAGALYLTGMVVAGAAAARIATAVGLRRALAGGGLTLGLGVLGVAVAPSMPALVGARLVEGLGGGLVLALSYALIRRRVSPDQLPRAFGMLALVYAVTAAAGPTVGGGLIDAAGWRWAVATILVPAAVFLVLLKRLDASIVPDEGAVPERSAALPLRRLALIAAAALAVGVSGVAGGAAAVLLLVAGVVGLGLAVRLDRTSTTPLLPAAAYRRGGSVGAGLAVVVLLPLAAGGIPLYAPLLHVLTEGGGGVASGLLVATHALAWSAAALIVTRLPAGRSGGALIVGPLLLASGLIGLIAATAAGGLAGLVGALILTGGGFGTCWAFLVQRITAAAALEVRPVDGRDGRALDAADQSEGDRAATAIPTVMSTGDALGAGLAGLLAGWAGVEAVAAGTAGPVPLALAVWLPAAGLALLAVWPARRLARAPAGV